MKRLRNKLKSPKHKRMWSCIIACTLIVSLFVMFFMEDDTILMWFLLNNQEGNGSEVFYRYTRNVKNKEDENESEDSSTLDADTMSFNESENSGSQIPGGQKIIEVAIGELGHGGSEYQNWYGMTAAWCAMFVSWCANQCGYLESGLIKKTAHSSGFWNYVLNNPDKGKLYTVADVREGRQTPQPGDILIVSAEDNKEASSTKVSAPDGGGGLGTRHVCLVEYFDNESKVIHTIDGNYSNKVSRATYTIELGSMGRNIWGFVRPAYPSIGTSSSNSGGGTGGGIILSGVGEVVHTGGGLDVDTDGDPDNTGGSQTWQGQTSLMWGNTAVNAALVNFVVVPMKTNGVYLGCLATVKDHTTGKILNAIVADQGRNYKPEKEPNYSEWNLWNELSIKLIHNLGYTDITGRYGVDESKQFTVTIYPNCKLTGLEAFAGNQAAINAEIDRQAAQYAKQHGGTVAGEQKEESSSGDSSAGSSTNTSGVDIFGQPLIFTDNGKITTVKGGLTASEAQAILNNTDKGQRDGGFCEAYVGDVYEIVLGTSRAGRWCCATNDRDSTLISYDKEHIPLGARVFCSEKRINVQKTDGKHHPCSGCGKYPGHVGIYVGDGKIISNVGGLRTESMEQWESWCGFGGWSFGGVTSLDKNNR